jgi:integrase
MARRAKGEGCLMRRPGSRFWWAQFFVNGKAVRKSTKKSVKEEALPVLRRLMGDVERGVPITDGKLRYSDLRAALIDDYVRKGNRSLEQRADGTEVIVGLPQLDSYCGFSKDDPGIKLSAITPEWIRAFIRKRTDEKAGPAMVNRSLQALRRGLNILREDGRIAVVPKVKLMKEPAARRDFLEPATFEELLGALPSYLRPLILLLYWTGVRKGEALAIEWDQVDLDAREIRLHDEQTKSGEPRVLPLPSRVVDLLRVIKPKHGKVFDGTNLRTEWETACAVVGLGVRTLMESQHERSDRDKPRIARSKWYKYKGLRLHDMRRSAVRNLRVLGGVPETVAMKISGHKTRAVFDRYNIVTTGDLHLAMQSVETASLALPPKKPASRAGKGKISVQKANPKLRKTLEPA